jgi:NAD(P)-dependent dehydrogenase (short-subunit alcohol dehydrogenase family)
MLHLIRRISWISLILKCRASMRHRQYGVDQIVSSVPLGRTGDVEEIASTALFLASDESAFVNGSELFADGGAAQV